MCLPRWQDVIGYEKKDPATLQKLQLGYPRFFYHPLVAKAFEQFKTADEDAVQIYATHQIAERCKSYLRRKDPDATIQIRLIGSLALIAYPETLAVHAKEYWQHAGGGISSRCAEDLLNGSAVPNAATALKKISARVADFTGAAADDVYLFSSGMAAINAAFLAAKAIRPDCATAQYAFPYGDTLKLQNKMGDQPAHFYPRGDVADLQALETDLQESPICGLFCEFPSNPLLTCADLEGLRVQANQHHFPLIIDETLGACINQNTLPISDVTAISLTKFFSGTSDVMGGALVINSNAPFASAFREQLKSIYQPDAFYAADALRLEKDSRGCRKRVQQINASALAICEFLQQHPAVDSVYYPAFTQREIYDRFRRPNGGYGGLFSFTLKDPEQHTEAVYNALEITKGPNLGTSFSLCCPFTLIAHYDELDWAEAAGASRWLLRISVGTEPAEELIARLARALKR